MWFYDDNEDLLMELNYGLDSTGTNDNRTIIETELTLNEGERIIGVRGDTSFENYEAYVGYWMALQFLVSDGTVDRVLDVGNVATEEWT